MKFYHLKFFIACILAATQIHAAEDSLLVSIGQTGITAIEFQQRFELIPQVISGHQRDLEQKKTDLLYSLIAEKLWALEAEKLKLDNSDIMQTTFKTIEKMFVRDALYKIEITDKVRLSEEEKLEGLKRIYTILELNVLQLEDSLSAGRIYSLLANGISFDSAKLITGSKIPSVQIKYGDLSESVENLLYSMGAGDFSPPIKSSSGWLIFKLIKREPVSIEKPNQALRNVEEIIEYRKTDKYYDEFHKKYFLGKKVETDGGLFWSIADKISSALNHKKISNSIPDSENIYLDLSDLLKIEKELGTDTLNMPFIKFNESSVTVKQYLREFIFDGFYSVNLNPKVLAAKLNSRIKTFIEQELLSREGYSRGLQNLPEVRSSIAMWKDNYLAKILKNMLLDSVKVTDEDIQNYYLTENRNGSNSIMEVNIVEILNDSLEVMETVLKQLENGEDFENLASVHTKRGWTRNNGGEFGFFPVTMYGEIGTIAATMRIGEMYGPIKLAEGYSLFKLIDKRETRFDSTLSFTESKDDIRKYLTYKKSADFFIDYTVKLANKYGVTINSQVFNSTEVSDMNMLVYRYLGFGGRIIAVPMALPFTEWYLPWKESNKLMP